MRGSTIIKCKICKKGKSYWNTRIKSGRGKFCSQKCYWFWKKGKRVSPKTEFNKNIKGSVHPSWRGGRYEMGGYIWIWTPKGEKLEHRVKMEIYLGRKLKSNEIIHHKNGNRLDNKLKNLELHNRASHARLHGMKHNNLKHAS